MKERFNYYIDFTDFSIGISVAKPNPCTGYKLYLSLDITFLSVWVYLFKLNVKMKHIFKDLKKGIPTDLTDYFIDFLILCLSFTLMIVGITFMIVGSVEIFF